MIKNKISNTSVVVNADNNKDLNLLLKHFDEQNKVLSKFLDKSNSRPVYGMYFEGDRYE